MPVWTVVGCSSGLAHPRWACSCYYLRHRNCHVLFDCGEGATSALRRCNVDPTKIDTIIISHTHPDHVIGLPVFLQYSFACRRTRPLIIYAPAEAVAPLKKLFDFTYVFPHKHGFPVEIKALTNKSIRPAAGFAVSPIPNAHLQRNRHYVAKHGLPNKLQCFSFAIQAGKCRIVYTADIGSIDDIVGILPDTNLLIIEGSHVDFSSLGDICTANNVRHVLLTHLAEEFDKRAILRKLRNSGVKRVSIACEGLQFAL